MRSAEDFLAQTGSCLLVGQYLVGVAPLPDLQFSYPLIYAIRVSLLQVNAQYRLRMAAPGSRFSQGVD